VAEFILKWVADIKSESVAGFISESLADIPRNQQPAIRQAILDLFARPQPKRCPHCERLLSDPG